MRRNVNTEKLNFKDILPSPVSVKVTLRFQYLKIYSKTCVKWPLKNRQNKGLNDKW